MKKKIAILGSTGSIGKSLLKIVDNNIKDLNDQITTLEAEKPKYQSNKGENKTFFEECIKIYDSEEMNVNLYKHCVSEAAFCQNLFQVVF